MNSISDFEQKILQKRNLDAYESSNNITCSSSLNETPNVPNFNKTPRSNETPIDVKGIQSDFTTNGDSDMNSTKIDHIDNNNVIKEIGVMERGDISEVIYCITKKLCNLKDFKTENC